MHESQLVNLVIYDKVVIVTLNRPDRLNALTPELFEAGCAILETVARDAGLVVAVLKGAGRAFCAGADLGVFRAEGFTKQDGEHQATVIGQLLAGTTMANNRLLEVPTYVCKRTTFEDSKKWVTGYDCEKMKFKAPNAQ